MRGLESAAQTCVAATLAPPPVAAGAEDPMLPDHAVQAPNDPRGEKYFAFAYGYIKGLIKAVDELA